jgi:energy-coupling factor transport system substrate-specific component
VCGVIGAALARVERRPAGRWRLALVCGVVGYAFAAFQDLGDWVNYSDHSLAQLGVYVGKGTGFDFVHAAGCLAFALAFGPALARALRRFERRLHVDWQPAAGLAGSLAAALLVAGALLGSPAAPGHAALAAGTPAGYLRAAQNADGGFGAAPGARSDPLFSGWVALALAAAGENPADVSHGGASVLAYIAAGAAHSADTGALERTILVAAAAGADPRRFGGADLVGRLRAALRRDGSVAEQTNLTAFAVLALRAAGTIVPGRTLSWLARQQDRDGGFNFATAGGASDVDDTGAVLEAVSGTTVGGVGGRSLRFLRRAQNRDGGFPASPGGASNAQSTAFAVQGLVAAGADPGAVRSGGSPSPLGYLDGLIAPDGHVRYSRGADQTPVWVTAQAAMALDRRPLPIAPAPRAVHRTSGSAGRLARSGNGPGGARAGREARRAAPRHSAARRAAARQSARRAAARRTAAARRRQARSTIPITARALPADAGFLTALALAPVGI